MKTGALPATRDTLLIKAIESDDLEHFIEIVETSGPTAQFGKYDMTAPWGFNDQVTCDICESAAIYGCGYHSVSVDDCDLCGDCYSPNGMVRGAPFVLVLPNGSLRFLEGDSLLTVAVGAKAFSIVEWLVCQRGSNPFEQTIYGCSVIDVCRKLAESQDEEYEKVLLLMTQYQRRRDFVRDTATMMKYSHVGYGNLCQT